MPKGYVIVHVTVNDADNYPTYAAAASEALKPHGGRFLARGGKAEVREGESRARHVIIEFDSYDKAVAWYESEDYAPALAMRKAWADADLVIVEGAD